MRPAPTHLGTRRQAQQVAHPPSCTPWHQFRCQPVVEEYGAALHGHLAAGRTLVVQQQQAAGRPWGRGCQAGCLMQHLLNRSARMLSRWGLMQVTCVCGWQYAQWVLSQLHTSSQSVVSQTGLSRLHTQQSAYDLFICI
jgi:hypothetical protein